MDRVEIQATANGWIARAPLEEHEAGDENAWHVFESWDSMVEWLRSTVTDNTAKAASATDKSTYAQHCLNPCAWCGHELATMEASANGFLKEVLCSQCGARTGERTTWIEACTLWNQGELQSAARDADDASRKI